MDRQKLIMLPGPTNVSERVMRAMLNPIINHRGDEFRDLYKGVLDKTKRFFQTQGEVVILSSSGTGGVEAAVWNLIRPGDVAVVPVFGEFSMRLAETVELAGGKVVRVASDFGKIPTIDQLKLAMEQQEKVKALFLVHNETSTGVAVPYVEEATKIARDHGAFVVIDAISSLGGYAIPVDRWGVDMCITGSQKCVAAPPGLALLSVSERVAEYLKDSPPKTRYFDLPRYLEYGAKGQTPFTPALPLYYALDEALEELLEEGLEKRVERHNRMSVGIYDGLAKLGLGAVAEKSVRSKTVVASYYPQGVDDSKFRKELAQDKGVVIAGGFGPFAGKVFRVGCMGQINEAYVETTLRAIGETLTAFGN
ncbi:MAG: alanine--glyoxylate aminotransferase family protein [Nitrososphaerota archaeon]|jgi:aspartate aminotransferase-like enzyme|nr:alanine--glyoxylate aminotransferase family protein [Nitrososphaerota archaeon]MDG6903478.1 alanine--glyoxylate aminotransferase family protein [Nitrososphaerota archaeon]MDG6912047.1 alanine--glyoxylate aminotransferase family protein [Nitrososphaerota archaeon]MDG6924779.1 alanine--glyoxylate aminotransferase family protein [Nitrososphaerota archaeon]MDG6940858.1 alanine--glyoxylate aminotransferase family protein [Nitrososphaerota archaeon]